MDNKQFEFFNRVALYLLIKLFENFPQPIDINAKDIAFDAKLKGDDSFYDEAWDSMDIAHHTVIWLQKEKFIEVESLAYGSNFIGVSLSLKGLTLLGYTPLETDNNKYTTIIEKGKGALLEGTKEGAREVIKQIFINSLRYVPQAFH